MQSRPNGPLGTVLTFLGVEREAGGRLSREDLVFSELYVEEAWGIELCLEPHDNDLFCKMDALWVATRGELPTALDPPEFLEAVRSSERVRRMREEFEEGRRVARHADEEEYLRTLTSVDRATCLTCAKRFFGICGRAIGSTSRGVARPACCSTTCAMSARGRFA